MMWVCVLYCLFNFVFYVDSGVWIIVELVENRNNDLYR